MVKIIEELQKLDPKKAEQLRNLIKPKLMSELPREVQQIRLALPIIANIVSGYFKNNHNLPDLKRSLEEGNIPESITVTLRGLNVNINGKEDQIKNELLIFDPELFLLVHCSSSGSRRTFCFCSFEKSFPR